MIDMSKNILTIIVCLILLAVGVFIIFTFVATAGMESAITETFNVADPSIDKVVTLKSKPAEKPTVIQFNGLGWFAVVAADVEWNGLLQLTVESEGMQG